MPSPKKTFQQNMLNSPFKWVGGKSRLRKYIIPLITPHSCFVDLFAGAGWILFGKPPSKIEILNDKDEDLITFFRVVKEKPNELIASFDWELVSRAEFERFASLNVSELTDIQRAHRFYYLIMAGWGGELAYPRFQTSINDGGHGNRLFGAIKNLHSRLEPIHKRLSTVIIENLTWQECFKQYDSSSSFFYIDPPYPGNKCNYVHNMKSWSEHYELYDALKSSKSRWIISSYDIPEMYQIFSESKYHIIPVSSYSGMNTDKNAVSRVQNKEILLLNFVPTNLSYEINIASEGFALEEKLNQDLLPF